MKPFNRRRDDDGERKEDIRHLMMSDVSVVQKPSSSYRVSRSRQNNNSSKCTMGQCVRKVGILLCFLFIAYDYSIVRNGNEGSHDSPLLRTSAGANNNDDDDVETTTSKLVITGSSHLQSNTNSNNNSLGSTTTRTTEKLAATPNVKSISQTTTPQPQKSDSSSLRKGDSSSVRPPATVVADTKSNNVEKLATPNANELETSSATPNLKLINPTTQPKPENGNDTSSSSPPPFAGVNTKSNNNNMETTTTTTTTTQSNKNSVKNQAMSSESIALATSTPSNNVKPISSSLIITQQRHLQIKPFPLNSNFCFIHISKCAGASWIELLQKQLSPNIFYPKHSHGEEYSLYYSQQTYDRSKEESLLQMLISFKSPRRHLWSLFTECKYDDWGRRQINGTNFPNIGNGKHSDNPSHISTKTDDDDFIYWMKHFFDQKSIPTTEQQQQQVQLLLSNTTPSERYYIPIRTDSFRCYHPANYQSRHLVSKMKVPHVTSRQDVEAVPPLTDVLEKYQTQLSWTALTEFFHESKCLFYWRYRKNQQSQNNNNEMVSYINNHCTCKEDNAPTHTETIVKHHDMEGNREHFYHMPPRTLEMMDALTTVDRILYQEALFDFIANIIEMEHDLKHTVLCNYATEKYENELKYILSSSSKEIPTNNITELVHLMRRERQNQQQQQQ